MGFFGWMGGVLPALLVRKAAPSPLLLLQNAFATAALHARTLRTLRTLQAYTLLHPQCTRVLHAALCAFAEAPAHRTMLAALYALRAVLRDIFVIPFWVPPALLALLLLPAPALPLALLLLALLSLVLRWSPLFPPPPSPSRVASSAQRPSSRAASKSKTPSPSLTPRIHTGGVYRVPLQFLLPLFSSFVRPSSLLLVLCCLFYFFVFVLCLALDGSRVAMTIALQSHLHYCARAGAVVAKLHFLSAAQVHTPQTCFFSAPEGADWVECWVRRGVSWRWVAVWRDGPSNRRAFFLRLARYGLRRARLVASWRPVGRFWRETTLGRGASLPRKRRAFFPYQEVLAQRGTGSVAARHGGRRETTLGRGVVRPWSALPSDAASWRD
ncbi:hypothetical protein C8J57DRAFT_1538666 [Mycena rebaudengoi]|nr:hypothetical protein C8J57DRAFT_1538666 [Mycena rebaudengoi]